MLYVKVEITCGSNSRPWCPNFIEKRANPVLYLSKPCGVSQDVVREAISEAIRSGWFVSIGQAWCPEHLSEIPSDIKEAGPITLEELDFPIR